MTPFDLVDNLKLPRKRGSVPREKLMNSEAWGAGIWTWGLTGVGAILTTPEDASVLLWVVGLVITGLFGVASSAVAVLLKHYLSERKSKRQAKRLED